MANAEANANDHDFDHETQMGPLSTDGPADTAPLVADADAYDSNPPPERALQPGEQVLADAAVHGETPFASVERDPPTSVVVCGEE